jgi:hypothetical protein
VRVSSSILHLHLTIEFAIDTIQVAKMSHTHDGVPHAHSHAAPDHGHTHEQYNGPGT